MRLCAAAICYSTYNLLKGILDMEVFMIMPTTPEGKAKLQHELAKFQAEWALKYVQNLSCPRMLNNPFGTKGALLYSPDGSMCVLRSLQPRRLNVRAVLRHFVPNKGLHPLRRLRVYPCPLCSGNNLLTQTIPPQSLKNHTVS